MKTDSPRIGIVDSGCAADGMDECRSASFVLVDGQVSCVAATPDVLGHGSAIGGVIRHLAPGSRLVVAQVFHQRFTTTALQVAAAIDWLVGEGIDVINLSLGLGQDRPALAAACARAVESGVIVCAASPARGDPVYPSAYPGVFRMTGDARCAREELSWLATRHADFGAHVRPLAGALAGSGASIGCAHLAGHVGRLLSAGVAHEAGAIAEALKAQAHYRGPERKRAES